MNRDLTQGNITKTLIRFALPMMAGNLLQQTYNVADTFIVGQFLGKDALAAVGSAYTLMTFLTSILLGLCMGSGVEFSICYGKRDMDRLKKGLFLSFVMIGLIAVALNAGALAGIDGILALLQTPSQVYGIMRDYVWVVFWGIGPVFLYNFYASLLRALGNSAAPLLFLGVSVAANIGLDLLFVLAFGWGVAGAAWATVLSQILAGGGICVYTLLRFPELRISKRHARFDRPVMKSLFQLSSLTCVQQSVMNFGILMVQGLVNSFGPAVMAAFAAAVKIDSFAYMPVQDFGNAFSTFIAQNYGANQHDRIRQGIKCSVLAVAAFCLGITGIVCLLAGPLMTIFVQPQETEIISIGVQYLRIEGGFYCLIGILFLLYGFYRGVKRPGMSVILTAISLGSRVALAYALSPAVGVAGIWASVPIGWFLADVAGIGYYFIINRSGDLLKRGEA